MSEPQTLTIDVNGFSTRVWRAGSGPKLGFLAGFGGLPRWMPILDELAKSPREPVATKAKQGLNEIASLIGKAKSPGTPKISEIPSCCKRDKTY